MKKLISGILTVAMLCALCLPVLAEDMKYIYEWTEEEWTAALEDWTEEDRKEYAVWLFTFLYEEDEDWEALYDYEEQLELVMEDWTDEQFEFYYNLELLYYANSRQLRIDQEKTDAGFPYMDGINVQVNGKFLTFSGPRAVVTGGATMIPADALAAALGAEYALEDSTGTLTLREESVSFTAGQEVSISSGFVWDYETYERVEAFTTATPYLEEGVLMVPLRGVTNAFGCTLLWQASYQLAIVLDRQTIVDEINKDFTIINRFLSALMEGGLAASDEPTETNLHATLEGMLYGESKHTTALLSADMTLLKNGDDLQAQLTVDTDAKNLTRLLDLTLGSSFGYYEDFIGEITEFLTTYIDGSHSVTVKGKDVYVKTPVASITAPIAEDKWIHTALEEEDVSDSSISQLAELFVGSGGYTIGDSVYGPNYSPYVSSYYYTNYYDSFMRQADLIRLFFGDKLFTVKGSTYTLSGNADSVFSSAVAAGLCTKEEKQDFMGSIGNDFSYAFAFTEDADKLSTFSMKYSAKTKGSFAGTIAMSADYSAESFHLDASYVGDILGKVVFALDSETAPTTKKVKAPPKDEVIEADALIGTPSYPEDEDWDYFGWVEDGVAD